MHLHDTVSASNHDRCIAGPEFYALGPQPEAHSPDHGATRHLDQLQHPTDADREHAAASRHRHCSVAGMFMTDQRRPRYEGERAPQRAVTFDSRPAPQGLDGQQRGRLNGVLGRTASQFRLRGQLPRERLQV